MSARTLSANRNATHRVCQPLALVVVSLAVLAGYRPADPTRPETVTAAPINADTVNNRLSVGASNLAAGDTIERTIDLKNTGSTTLANATLITTATTSSLLDTDTNNGLQMTIDRCSAPWSETGGPPYTYTCSGTTSSVLACGPVIVSNLALANLNISPGVDNYLRVTLTLPSSAPNTLQDQTSTIQYAFTANAGPHDSGAQITNLAASCAGPVTQSAPTPVVAPPGFVG